MFPPVIAHLMADISQFAAKMGEAEALQAKVAHSGASTWAAASKQMMGVGAVMAVGAGLVAYHTVKMAADFQTLMERVHTQAGASQAEVGNLSNKVLGLAVATGQGPTKLAEALFHVESVGYRGATAMNVLTDSAKLASISGANLDDTTYGLTSVMQTFGAKANESAKYAALFNATVGAGDMRMEAFNRAVGTGFYSTAQTFGISAQSASAALAFMTDRGAHADEAATRLRMTIALLAAPSARSTSILHGLGLTANEVAVSHTRVDGVLQKAHLTYSTLANDLRKPDGFAVALTHLKKALIDSGMSADAANAQLSHAFGGGKSDSTILAMLNNLDTLRQKYAAVGKGMGSYAEAYAKAQETATVKMERFKAAAEVLGIKIGQQLMPYALALLGWLERVLVWMDSNQSAVKVLAALIGGALVVGLLMATAGFIGLAIATAEIWVPIMLIIVGVGLLVAAVVWVWTNWSTIWGWVVDRARAVGGWLAGVWQGIWSKVVQVWNSITAFIKAVWTSIGLFFTGAWHAVVDPIARGWTWLQQTTERVWNAIKAFFAKWWPLLLVIFALPMALLIGAWNHWHVAIHTAAVTAWNAIKSFFAGVWQWIVNNARAAWNIFYAVTVAPVIRAAHTVQGWIGTLARWAIAGFERVLGWVRGAWQVFYAVAIAPVQRAASAVGTWMANLYHNIYTWFETALTYARGILGDWYDVGANIVKGIISAVQNLAGWAWDQIKSFANGLLNAAKSLLGINSPSRVFADVIGRGIVEGVAYGVDQHAHVAHASMRRFTDGLSKTASVAISPSISMTGLGPSRFATSGALGNGGGVMHLTVHHVTTLDGRVLFKETQKQALKYESRNALRAFSQ